MSIQHYVLPDPGEGLTEAEIVSWKVQVGDEVKVNDVVVEVETAKSLVELPVPFAGTVVELLAAEGDEVEVGARIIAIDDGQGGSSAPAASGGASSLGADAGSGQSADSPAGASSTSQATAGNRGLHPFVDPIDLARADEWSNFGIRECRIANFHRGAKLSQLFRRFHSNARVRENTLHGDADLACVVKAALCQTR